MNTSTFQYLISIKSNQIKETYMIRLLFWMCKFVKIFHVGLLKFGHKWMISWFNLIATVIGFSYIHTPSFVKESWELSIQYTNILLNSTLTKLYRKISINYCKTQYFQTNYFSKKNIQTKYKYFAFNVTISF